MSCNSDTNLCINQYASYKLSLQFTDVVGAPLDISTWMISGSIKEKYKSTGSVVDFGIETVSLPSASINIYLTPDQTALLTKSQYVYDLIAQVSGSSPEETVRLLEGTVSIDPGVTEGA